MSDKKQLRLTDQVIGQIREVLQLAMLTGTNFVDHMRALRLEESEQTEGGLILSKDYVEGWNAMAESLHAEAMAKAATMVETIADDEVVESDEEVVISRDASGKLVGTRQKIIN
jgi:hypothetical protein